MNCGGGGEGELGFEGDCVGFEFQLIWFGFEGSGSGNSCF